MAQMAKLAHGHPVFELKWRKWRQWRKGVLLLYAPEKQD